MENKGGANLEIRELAWQFMLKNHVNDFRVKLEDIKTLIQQNGWHLFSYHEGHAILSQLHLTNYAQNHNGFTYVMHGEKIHYLIFYKDELSYTTKTFVLLHEIGHIVLNHTYIDGIFGQGQSTARTRHQETEADIFALEFMAPSCLLKTWHINTVDKVKSHHLIPQSYVEQYVLSMYTEKHFSNRISFKMHLHYFRIHYDLLPPFCKFLLPILLSAALCLVPVTWYLCSSGLSPARPAQTSSSVRQASLSQKVYITSSGQRYHRSTCPHIQNHTTYAITRKEAYDRHFTPCLTCHPDQKNSQN